jgi:hypothetical protein
LNWNWNLILIITFLITNFRFFRNNPILYPRICSNYWKGISVSSNFINKNLSDGCWWKTPNRKLMEFLSWANKPNLNAMQKNKIDIILSHLCNWFSIEDFDFLQCLTIFLRIILSRNSPDFIIYKLTLANFRFENFEIQVANSNCLYWHKFRSISLPSFALLIVYFSSVMCQCLRKRFALMEVLTFARIHLWNKSIFIQSYHNWSSNQILYVNIRYFFPSEKGRIHP